jgi:hypothetical protein
LNNYRRLCISPRLFFTKGFYLFLLLILSSCDLIDPVLPAGELPVATAVPIPTATTDPSSRFVSYLSTDFGVSIRYPPNWIINDDINLMVASSAELLTHPDTIDSGALLLIESAPEAMISSDNLAAPLRNYVIDQGGFKITEEPDSVLIGGQPAAILSAVSTDAAGKEITHIFALFKNGRAGIIASGSTLDPVINEPLLRGIIRTIIVSRPEPIPVPPTLTPRPPSANSANIEGESLTGSMAVPVGLLQYKANNGYFSLGYPANWQVQDDGAAIVFASSEELLADNKFESGASTLIFSHLINTQSEPDAVKFLEDFIAQFAIYDALELVVAPQPVILGDQNAAYAQYDVVFQRYPLIADYYVIINGQYVVIMVNLITAKEFEVFKPITDGMAASITINP